MYFCTYFVAYFLQTTDNSGVRIDDNDLRITVNNDEYHSTSARKYATGIAPQLPPPHRSIHEPPSIAQFAGDQSYKPVSGGSAHLSHFGEAPTSSRYSETYKEPQPVPPVKEILHQTGRLLSQVDTWNPVSLQPVATAATQSAVSQPLLVNISNSKYTTLDASSSLAQNVLKNISFLGKAFSSSTVTFHTSDSITATCGSTLPSTSTPIFASSTVYDDKTFSSVVSSKLEDASASERLSLKYRQLPTSSTCSQSSSTATSSVGDPVIANVLKSIGFNFDLSKFDSAVARKEREQSYPSSLQYTSPPQPVPPVQRVDPVQSSQHLARVDSVQSSQNLATPLKDSTITAYDKIVEMKPFSEINKVLQKVRENSKSQLRSRSPVKERVRSRSGHRSSPESREGDRSVARKSPRSTAKQKQKEGRERRERVVEERSRLPRQEGRRDEPRRRASPSPPQYGTRALKAPKRKSYSPRSPSSSPHRRRKSDDRERRPSPKASAPVSYLPRAYPHHITIETPKASAPVSYPPHPYPLHSTIETPKASAPVSYLPRAYPHHSTIETPKVAAPVSYPPHPYPHHSTIETPKVAAPVSYPPHPYPLQTIKPLNWQKFPLVPKAKGHDEWEKSTEEFLRKLHKTSRPSGAPLVRGYSPGFVSDLSSLSSDESISGDIGGDSNEASTLPQKSRRQAVVGKSMDTTSRSKQKRGNVKLGSSQNAHSKSSRKKNENVTKTSKPHVSADRRANLLRDTESSSRVKKVCKLLLLV